MNVNWLGVSILDAKGKTTYDGAFVTSLPLTRDNVVDIAACARVRWDTEDESFNVLKTTATTWRTTSGMERNNWPRCSRP
jgi:hypothetical protein